jgi:hypothetical protein
MTRFLINLLSNNQRQPTGSCDRDAHVRHNEILIQPKRKGRTMRESGVLQILQRLKSIYVIPQFA